MATTLLPHKFGPYGGQFVPETLMPALIELEEAFVAAKSDPAFQKEFNGLMASFVGRRTPLTYAKRLSEKLGGAQIYLKREDLAHTGAHKINNALGQALLVKRMRKGRVVAETGAGQHGVASATVSALLGLECVVYMGSVDMARQEPNVFRMKLLGAEVRPVTAGTQTLKDAINEAIRDWVTNVRDTHYLLGSALGPQHAMLRDAERAFYTSATDTEALDAFSLLCRTEGIIPALESSHAVAEAVKRAPKMKKDQIILVNLSGRGDKDLNTVIQQMNRA